MKKNITISIITATWNCAKTLPDCLASVSLQNYEHREHLIIDGASTDGTIDIILNNLSQITKFKSEHDTGIYDALNKGIHLASGDIIGFLHADDFYYSCDVLSKIAKEFENPNICAVYGDLIYVSQKDNSKVIRKWKSCQFNKNKLGWGWMPPHPTFYVRREWYLRLGGFDTSYHISADYLSILKLFMLKDFKTKYIPEVLITMRLGGASNKSFRVILRKTLEDWRALRSCKFSLLGSIRAIFTKNLSKIKQLF